MTEIGLENVSTLTGIKTQVGESLADLIKRNQPDNSQVAKTIFDHRDKGKSYRDTHSVLAMGIVFSSGESKPWIRMVLSQADSQIKTDVLKIKIGKGYTSQGQVNWPFFMPSSGPDVDKPIEDNELIMKFAQIAFNALKDNQLLVSVSGSKI